MDPDRTWTWRALNLDVQRGGISEDGRVVTSAGILGGVQPAMTIITRQEGSFDLTSLNGVYHLCALFYDFSGPELEAWWGTVTFDGAGNTQVTFERNEGGNFQAQQMTATTYTVAANGTATLDSIPGSTYEGGVLLGGDLVVLGGSTVNARDPGLIILIREGSGLGTGSAAGSYFVTGIGQAPVGYASITGSAAFDGAGALALGLTSNTNGGIAAQPPANVTYTVAPNGILMIDAGGGELFRGAITQDGCFGMVAGETTGAGNPSIRFFMK